MKPEVRARLVYAISDHVHVASEAGAALDAVVAVVEEALEEARDQALSEALEAVERGCSDPDAARCVMQLQ